MKPQPRIRKTVKWGGLALFVLLAGMWVRSEFRGDQYGYRGCVLNWHRGSVTLCVGAIPEATSGFIAFPVTMFERHFWCSWHTGSRESEVEFALWVPLIGVVLPTGAAWRLDALARRRARGSACPKCSYDRAGIAGDAKCPECGAVPAKS